METLDNIANIGVLFTGLIAIYLAASQNKSTRRLAGWFGLAGEPFWFTTALIHSQYGVMALCLVYGVMWWRVIKKNGND